MPNPVSYQDAYNLIRSVASTRQDAFGKVEVRLPLTEVVGRVASCDVISPIDTPTFDSSAMDGYAVNSAHTLDASPISPITLQVRGCVMAGDPVMEVPPHSPDGCAPCVEIMTGAAFPAQFDACIPFEQAFPVEKGPALTESAYVQVLHPASPNQHRRPAGSDYRKGDFIINKGSIVESRHSLAAASTGIQTLTVSRKVQVAVLSTGSELQASRSDRAKHGSCTIPDANGPFLVSALQSFGAEVVCVDSVPDNVDASVSCLTQMLQAQSLDLVISTGAVSAGKLDLIPQVIATLGGSVHFHHVAMRPGHPVLFASLPDQYHAQRSERNGEPCSGMVESNGGKEHNGKETAFFGLPGNPIAAAASFRFLVTPYIRELLRTAKDSYVPARVVRKADSSYTSLSAPKLVLSNPRQLDQFRHGHLTFDPNGVEVQISSDQSPAKIRPFVEANCWVHVPRHMTEVFEGDLVHTYVL